MCPATNIARTSALRVIEFCLPLLLAIACSNGEGEPSSPTDLPALVV
jgi:hypothetical protein